MTTKNKISAKTICITALSMALICVSTMFIQIHIPLGYAHFGNTFILLIACCFGKKVGLISAGFGSALADLLSGFAIWIIPTLIIKMIMGFMIGMIAQKKDGSFKMISIKVLLAAVLSNVWMVIGYTLSGAIIYGSLATGLTSSPGLIFEGVVNIILFYIIGFILEKSKVFTLIRK